MKIRDNKTFDNLNDILGHLGDPTGVGKDNTWVAKNYSLAQLILDLTKIKSELPNHCDVCGREISQLQAHSGNGEEELCFECYHDIYDKDEENE